MDTVADQHATSPKNSPVPEPLDSFLSRPSISPSLTEITQISSNARGGFDVEPSRVYNLADLAKLLNPPAPEQRILLIHNLSPDVAKSLNDHLQPDPQFFLDYLHMIERGSETDTTYKPFPWYRLTKVEADLPMLNSLRKDADHIHIRFIELREYKKDTDISWDSRILQDYIQVRPDVRLNSDSDKVNVGRIAGLYVPISREDAAFSPIALIRRVISVWFGRPMDGQKWTIGLVLLDPPFETRDAEQYGKQKDSLYRSFMPSKIPPDRTSYRATLAKYLGQTMDLKEPNAPHLMLIIQGIFRIVASEWIVASACLERDLNAIEWRLETEQVDLDGFKYFLKQLLVGRRRVHKYHTLVDSQLELFREEGKMLPTSWRADGDSEILEQLRVDFTQVRAAFEKHSQRIAQTIDLITSVMAVRQSKQSIQQNSLLGVLAVVATLGVPFSVVAGILGMQTSYGPGQADFLEFWKISGVVVGIISGISITLIVAFRFNMRRRVKAYVRGILFTRSSKGAA